MIEIYKGKKKVKTTMSAYENFYKNAGWFVNAQNNDKVANADVELNNDTDENDDWDEVDEYSKPLSEMNREELERKAAALGVSIAGLTTNKQIREAIKRVL